MTNLSDLQKIKINHIPNDIVISPETPDDQGFYLENGIIHIYSGKEEINNITNNSKTADPIAVLKGPCIVNCLSILSGERIQKYAVAKSDVTIFIFSIKTVLGHIRSKHPFLNAILETNLERTFKHIKDLS